MIAALQRTPAADAWLANSSRWTCQARGETRIGRFGWKINMPACCRSARDAYLNEMGITNPLNKIENTSNGHPVAEFDPVPDPEDDGAGLQNFATFIRSLKAPPRDAALAALL
jgi:hypothetical protein